MLDGRAESNDALIPYSTVIAEVQMYHRSRAVAQHEESCYFACKRRAHADPAQLDGGGGKALTHKALEAFKRRFACAVSEACAFAPEVLAPSREERFNSLAVWPC